MLEIRGLQAKAGDRQILNGIDLAVNPGEIHAVMGPNGSGKSTFDEHHLAGRPGIRDHQWRARRRSRGKPLQDMEPEVRAREGIFVAFQYPVEIPGVKNNVLPQGFPQRQVRKPTAGQPELDAMDFLGPGPQGEDGAGRDGRRT